jgi:predicted NBD/HSP70 family sugar kinase
MPAQCKLTHRSDRNIIAHLQRTRTLLSDDDKSRFFRSAWEVPLKHPIEERKSSYAELARHANRGAVLDSVRRISPTSVGQIAEEVHLSRATVTSIVSEMLQSGLLEDAGQADSTGGRRPALLRFRSDARLAIGVVALDGEIVCVLTDLDGQILKRHVLPWDGRSAEDMLRAVIEGASALVAGIARERIVALGLGLPGVIQADSGAILCCTSMGWYGPPIDARRIVEAALGWPTYVANRSRIASLGEIHAGVGRGASSLLYVYLGRGVVAGIVLNEEIYAGASSNAGELGHSSIVADGPLCHCGNRGCVELYASESAVVNLAAAKARDFPDSMLRLATGGQLQSMTLDTVIASARAGDPAASAVFSEVGKYLGMALSQVLNALDPQMLVLGGPVGCKAGELLLQPTYRELQRRMAPMMLDSLRVAAGSIDMDSTAIGAAILAIRQTPIERLLGMPK